MKHLSILLFVTLLFFSPILKAQSNYIGMEVGLKSSLTTQIRILWVPNYTLFSSDYTTGILWGRKTKKGVQFETWLNYESFALKYYINDPLLINHENNIVRRYDILNMGIRAKLPYYTKDKLSIGSYFGLGYMLLYNTKHIEITSGTIEGVNHYPDNGISPERDIPFIMNYNETAYTYEGHDTYTFNLNGGLFVHYQISPKLLTTLRVGGSLGLSPIMSRVLNGTIKEQIFTFSINETFVISKGDHISLQIGLLYSFKGF